MKVWVIVVIIAVILLIVLMGLIFSFFAKYVSMPVNDLERSINWEKEHKFFRNFDKRDITEYILKSFDGYEIHTYFVPNPDFKDSKNFVIISHGYTSSHYGALKYLNKWMELGYNCVIYDDRFHGKNLKSWKKPCTLGVNEAKDLITVINDTYARYGNDIYLGLQGESMGSALQITALKYNPRVHFIVNDCGFAELYNVLTGRLKVIFHLHNWIIWPASFMCNIIFKWSFFKNRPIDSLKNNTVPICFVHGADDKFVTPDNSFRMAAANPAYSEIHIFENAKHAETMLVDEERYLGILKNFLNTVKDIEDGKRENKSDIDFMKEMKKYGFENRDVLK